MSTREKVLISSVMDKLRANNYPRVVRVTHDEYEACLHAVKLNLIERGDVPIPFSDKDGRLLFKGCGLEE